MRQIHMVDLVSQYQRLKNEIDGEIEKVLLSAAFINGPGVKEFSNDLGRYMGVKHIIPCANGTDALQMALMALDLPQGSEVITAGFSYIALAEVCALLKLNPVFIDVDPHTFNLDPNKIEAAITPNTKVIAPVHLFGQCADMEPILAIAEKHNLYVIEDNAQAIGADYTFANGKTAKAGTMGHIGTTSFFPSKNLGCYGDGGAISTNDDQLAEKLRMIANHGQKVKYYHDCVGVNSRLDTLQAAILKVKLKYLDEFIAERQAVAEAYDKAFADHKYLQIPVRLKKSSHVFHQYTLKTSMTDIPAFRKYLESKGVPTMIYYPLSIHKQNAYAQDISLPVSEQLPGLVFSLPIGTDMDAEQIEHITSSVLGFFEEMKSN